MCTLRAYTALLNFLTSFMVGGFFISIKYHRAIGYYIILILLLCLQKVDSYVQFMWQDIESNQDNLYNGAAIAALTLFGALSAFAVGSLSSKYFDRWDLWIITGCSALQCGLIFWLTFTDSLIVAYIAYVLFGTLYHFLITVAR